MDGTVRVRVRVSRLIAGSEDPHKLEMQPPLRKQAFSISAMGWPELSEVTLMYTVCKEKNGTDKRGRGSLVWVVLFCRSNLMMS